MTEYLELKATDCKHCYKCIRNCPVKAIKFSGNQATIMQDECILCGKCFVSCPQNAKRIHSDLENAKAMLKSGNAVFASVAPSFVANYPGAGIGNVKDALVKLGFSDASETAIGATLVKQRYDEMVNNKEQNVIVSTCCHSINMLVQKHYPAVLPYMAHTLSPMQAHAASIKQQHPDAKVIFIGPCVSKKAEAEQYPGTADCVLTFEELDCWLAEAGIEIARTESEGDAEGGKARLFPTCGGILRTMDCANKDYDYIAVDGMTACLAALEDIATGTLNNCFIEMSACNGSCIGGPGMSHPAGLVRSVACVNAYAADEDFKAEPIAAGLDKQIQFNASPRPKFGEDAIADVLKKIGKTKKEDELNCGSCGYDTCREKAQAVLEGKASLEMCLPHLMSRAQSFSDTIIRNTPNGIVVLNEALDVQQINKAACRIMNIKNPDDVLGRSVVCLMEPTLFLEVLDRERPIYDSRQYLAEYDRYVKMTVIRDADYGLVIGIMRDITETETTRAARKEMAEKTIHVTDEVIDRQMRTVQEIASLLGETAAETKIALTKLKETLSDD